MSGYKFRRDPGNARLTIVHPDGTDVWRLTAASGSTMLGGVLTVAGDLVVTAGVVTLPTASLDADGLATTAFDGTNMSNVADVNVIGGGLVLFRIKTAGGATATINVTMTHKVRVLDVWCVNAAAGGANDTLQVLSTGNAITNAMDINKADEIVTRAGTIADANHEIIATGTLRVTETDGAGANSPAVDVFVLACRVA